MIASKMTERAKSLYTLLRENIRDNPDTYVSSAVGVGILIATPGMFKYVRTNEYNGWMFAGLVISLAAITYELSFLRKK